MPRQLDLDTLYLLLPAFDRLGRRLYGEDWTGFEAWARPTDNPEEVRRKRRRLADALTAVKEDLARLDRRGSAAASAQDEEQLAAIHEERVTLRARQEAVEADLRALPDLRDSLVADHAAYRRRVDAEKVLKDALAAGELTALYGNHRLIEWRQWAESPRFRLDITLSLAVAPAEQSSLRRAPVFFQVTAFETWLESVPIRNLPAEESLSPEQRCRAFLKECVQANRRKPKDTYREEAMRAFPDLSIRAFNRVWAETVPDTWKRGGRLANPRER